MVCRRLNRSGSIGPQANKYSGLCLGDGFYVPEGSTPSTPTVSPTPTTVAPTTAGLKCSTDGKVCWKPDFTNDKECCRKFGLQSHPDPTKSAWPIYHFGSGTCSGGMQKTEQEWIDWAAGNNNKDSGLCLGDGFYVPEGSTPSTPTVSPTTATVAPTTAGLKCSTDGKVCWKPDFTNDKECCAMWGLQAHPDPTKSAWPVYHFGSGTCSGGMQKTEQEWIDWAAGNNNKDSGLCLGDGFYVPEGSTPSTPTVSPTPTTVAPTTAGLKCSTDGKVCWKPDFTNDKECCAMWGLQAHPDPTKSAWPVYHFGSGTCSGGMQKTEQEWIDWAAGNNNKDSDYAWVMDFTYQKEVPEYSHCFAYSNYCCAYHCWSKVFHGWQSMLETRFYE